MSSIEESKVVVGQRGRLRVEEADKLLGSGAFEAFPWKDVPEGVRQHWVESDVKLMLKSRKAFGPNDLRARADAEHAVQQRSRTYGRWCASM